MVWCWNSVYGDDAPSLFPTHQTKSQNGGVSDVRAYDGSGSGVWILIRCGNGRNERGARCFLDARR